MRLGSLSWFISRRMSIVSKSQISLFHMYVCKLPESNDYLRAILYTAVSLRSSNTAGVVIYLWGMFPSWVNLSHFWYISGHVSDRCQAAEGYMWSTVRQKWESCSGPVSWSCTASWTTEPSVVWEIGLCLTIDFSQFDASDGWQCCLIRPPHGWGFYGSHQHSYLHCIYIYIYCIYIYIQQNITVRCSAGKIQARLSLKTYYFQD